MSRMNWDRVRVEKRDYEARLKGLLPQSEPAPCEPPTQGDPKRAAEQTDKRLQCPVCQVRVRSVQKLNSHLSGAHNWPPPGTRGTTVWRAPQIASKQPAKSSPQTNHFSVTISVDGSVAERMRVRCRREKLTPSGLVLRALRMYLR
jgi:hypothetical protein